MVTELTTAQCGKSADYTVEELEKMSCRAYGGNNCALHVCMFECRRKANIDKLKGKEKEASRDNGVTRLQINWEPKK